MSTGIPLYETRTLVASFMRNTREEFIKDYLKRLYCGVELYIPSRNDGILVLTYILRPGEFPIIIPNDYYSV